MFGISEIIMEAEQSDVMKNLVLLMIGLAVLGTVIALAWYFGVELPGKQALIQAPMNRYTK